MSTENKQDTITVELPIAAHDEGYVGVDHAALATRERWREIAADPVGADASPLTTHVAPVVVAWIERDEWKPLDVPEVGRTIRATLRDGSEVEGNVHQVVDRGNWVDVLMGNDAFSINTSPKAYPDPADITAWEYVPEPAVYPFTDDMRSRLAVLADDLEAAFDAIRAATK